MKIVFLDVAMLKEDWSAYYLTKVGKKEKGIGRDFRRWNTCRILLMFLFPCTKFSFLFSRKRYARRSFLPS